ncbi:zinc-binding dehydrogenase [Enterobacter hormaechei]|nr:MULTISPECIES: zinc-binding dehydrogenase [Enterobacteriaceae]EUL97081.1 hypothetical protein P826_01235 [Enterobacter hormaechei]KJL64292.1 hypothetical protein SS38_24305 [Enterobacter hormaechei subsp. xiangfangensis]KTA17981.1 hypothetical protein AOX76_21595 [Salmonella enterica subsp. enterica serovar Paratyphi B]KTA18683.1 hypothetical protein AOX75_21510 [Salmonella enterica subsp. enterica serovar Paratyphi B]SAB24538.1 Uncharacterised protein [Enterobacter hormaechei]
MNQTMTALVLENFGDDKFARKELPVPQPQAGQVLVRAHHGEVLKTATRLVEEGKIRPVVDARHFSLDQAIDAHHAVQDGSASIKVVIDVI